MPEELDRCVKKLIAKGYSEDQAWAICKSSIKETGNPPVDRVGPPRRNRF